MTDIDVDLPVLYLDREGRIVDTNASMADFLLFRRAEIVGRELRELTPSPDALESRDAVDRLLSQGHLRAGDLQLVARDGTEVRCGFRVVGHLLPEVTAVTCSVEECVPAPAEAAPTRPTSPIYGRAFEERAEAALVSVRNEGRPLSMLSIELDRAKDIPTPNGTERRAAVLTQDLPTVYAHILRPSDIVGRLSPGEYVVVLPRTDLKGAMRVAERLRVSSADQSFCSARGTMSRATVSIGIATTRTAQTTTKKLWSRARSLRTQARVSGGNRVVA
ncbi:MAG TPA: diguanylate cyclase [Nevskiaceae bacterium]|nr:diguanylate cyclase [Nevskiaceae bacterium]